MNKFYIILFLIINSCGLNQKKDTGMIDSNINITQSNDFLKNYKPINHIKNVKSERVEKFHIIINKQNTLLKDDIKFYKIDITGFSDSIYVGLNKNILYTYDSSKKYLDKALVLDSNSEKGYYSFFCGFDYRIDKISSEYEIEENDTVYDFSMTKLKSKKGSDYFYYSDESPSKVFQRVIFSKKRGIIEAVFYDVETNKTYITIDKKEP